MRKGVQKIYTEVAETYESINHILTFGLDIFMRHKAVQEVTRIEGRRWLDICSGTGEMTLNLSRRAGPCTEIFSVDFSYPMLKRAREKSYKQPIHFAIADVAQLPFPDEMFDLVSISFSIRNLNLYRKELLTHLVEFYRILKPGGQFLNLETSQPSSKILRNLFHLYINKIVRPVGSLLSGSKAGYGYLSYTVPRFHPPDEFSALLIQSGFSKASYRTLLFGIAAIHLATK